jgi:hypothetical protein
VDGWPHADYDAEVRAMDRAIADLLRAWDAATGGRGSVIVVGDHGEGLLRHGELTHGTQLYEEDVHVPCLWRVDDPRAPANRVLRRARSTTEIPDGVPWAAGLVPDPPQRTTTGPFLVETFAPEGRRDRSAVIAEDGRKLLVDRATGEETAYDLSVDPGETSPVAATGERWDTLRERLAGPAVGSADDLDPETIRRLKALGYLH